MEPLEPPHKGMTWEFLPALLGKERPFRACPERSRRGRVNRTRMSWALALRPGSRPTLHRDARKNGSAPNAQSRLLAKLHQPYGNTTNGSEFDLNDVVALRFTTLTRRVWGCARSAAVSSKASASELITVVVRAVP